MLYTILQLNYLFNMWYILKTDLFVCPPFKWKNSFFSRTRTCNSNNAKNWSRPIIYDEHFQPDQNVTVNPLSMKVYKMISKYKNKNSTEKDSLFVSDLNFKMLNDGRLNYNGSE